jgi:hypothetical protein
MAEQNKEKKSTDTARNEGGVAVVASEGDGQIPKAREHSSSAVDDPHGRELIAEMLKKVKEKLKEDTPSPTLSEFIRLVQLDREMAEEDPPKEIRVSWSELKMESDIEP